MSSPSRPLDIASPRSSAPLRGTPPNAPAAISGSPSPRFLRAQYAGTPPPPNIPRRGTPIGTPSAAGSSPLLLSIPFASAGEPSSLGGISARRPISGTPGSGVESNALDELTDEEKARILRRHLVSRGERDGQASSRGSISGGSEHGAVSKRSSVSHLRIEREDTEPFPVTYHAPGADVTIHNIYKWQADKRRQAARPRAASFSGSHNSTPDPVFQHLHEPGGFRRNYLLTRSGNEHGELPHAVPRNFIEFLYLFGHFAGEDLEEIDEEDEYMEQWQDEEAQAGEPALAERLLKSFVGTGILFLGKAFFNGGILFSSAVLTFIALISLYSFLLLVKTKFVVSGSFGDIGGTLYGPWMRYAILGSITISQVGFVSAYIIFVSENLQAFVLAVTNCATQLGIQYFILLQMFIFVPLALIRNLAKLSTTALVADAFYEDKEVEEKYNSDWFQSVENNTNEGEKRQDYSSLWRLRRFMRSFKKFHEGSLDLTGRSERRYSSLKSRMALFLEDVENLRRHSTRTEKRRQIIDQIVVEVDYKITPRSLLSEFYAKYKLSDVWLDELFREAVSLSYIYQNLTIGVAWSQRHLEWAGIDIGTPEYTSFLRPVWAGFGEVLPRAVNVSNLYCIQELGLLDEAFRERCNPFRTLERVIVTHLNHEEVPLLIGLKRDVLMDLISSLEGAALHTLSLDGLSWNFAISLIDGSAFDLPCLEEGYPDELPWWERADDFYIYDWESYGRLFAAYCPSLEVLLFLERNFVSLECTMARSQTDGKVKVQASPIPIARTMTHLMEQINPDISFGLENPWVIGINSKIQEGPSPQLP
ncbi:predicted protein [Postia placenta Mad-698-R]|nr:predicted protein [Postia placenta Mad-698-R]